MRKIALGIPVAALLVACGQPFQAGSTEGTGAGGASSSASAGSTSNSTGAASSGQGGARECSLSEPAFPMLITACTNSQSCSFGLHQVDCCGTKLAIGFNHASTEAFAAAEAAWEKACASCSCNPKETRAQDGKTGKDPAVTCDMGQCKTSIP